MGWFDDMFKDAAFTTSTGPAKDSNNLNQSVYNVSDVDNPSNYNQSTQISDYDQMISNLAPQYDTTSENLEDIMNRISYHETGPSQRMDSTTIQEGGGPGRGLFQFESGPKGSETGGGATAMGYLRQYYRDELNQEPPAWTEYDISKGVDASKLTPEQQKMMFLANTAMSGNRSFEGVTQENLANWWNEHHYAGPENKMDLFNESMNAYDVNNTPTAEELAFP